MECCKPTVTIGIEEYDSLRDDSTSLAKIKEHLLNITANKYDELHELQDKIKRLKEDRRRIGRSIEIKKESIENKTEIIEELYEKIDNLRKEEEQLQDSIHKLNEQLTMEKKRRTSFFGKLLL